MYVLYTAGIYMIVHRLSGFRWSAANVRLAACFVPLVAAVFAGEHFLSPIMAVIFGGAVTLLAGIFSLKTMCTLIPMKRLPRAAQKLLALCRLAPVAEGI
jgi:PST family polysaccharide transporter